MPRYKKMTDAEILAAVEREIKGGASGSNSELSKERQLVLDYYNGKKPLPQHAGNSKYVSMDVYDAVESAKTALLETFAAGTQIAKFDPEGPDDVEDAKTATEYTEYVIHRQNNGYGIFSTAIHDGLTARIGIAKVYWDKCSYDYEEDFTGTAEELDMLLGSDESVSLKEEATLNEDGSVSATIIRTRDESKVCIENIPPEEFIISATAKSIDDEEIFKAHRMKKCASDLLKPPFNLSQSQIDDIPTETDLENSQEKDTRAGALSSNQIFADNDTQKQTRTVIVYESYIYLDVEGTGKAKCWQIIHAGNVLISKEQYQDNPFVPYVPLPMAHQALGTNFAKMAVPIQNARSVLIRGILDHTVITNNPRTMVVKGALVNPREMLDNRLGGIVNVTRPDGVFPYPQAGLNPYVFQTVQLLDEDKEDNTGISKLSQGLNKDAVSQQNSADLVDNLVSLSQQRQKIQARNFAIQFVIPLYLKVYQLVLENENRKKIIEVAGKFKEFDPQKWRERTKVSTILKLGYGEQEREVAKQLTIYQFLNSDPEIKHLFTANEKYNLIKKMLDGKGEKNTQEYIKDPNVPDPNTGKPPQPAPNPLMQAELAEKQAKTAQMQADTQLAASAQKFEQMMEQMKVQLDKQAKMIDLMVQQRDMERKEFESKSRDEIAHRELDILEENKPMETKQTNIVSPNS